jgi:hypothetical protein
MTEFTELPLQKLLNRQNILSRVENLERGKVRPSAVVQQLGQIGGNTGNLIIDGQVTVIDPDDGLPNITIDRDGGITLRNQIGALIFQSLTGTAFDDVLLYINSADYMVLENAILNSGITISVKGAASTDTADYTFLDDGMYINNVNTFTGWFTPLHTWTRTGNHTFAVSGDVTAIYRKGAKVRYGDGGTDYGIIYSSSHSGGTTTVTLITNTDYLMAAATITDQCLSYAEYPEGFPQAFNWAAAPANLTVGNGTLTAKYQVKGHMVFGHLEFVFGNTSAVTGDVTFTLPVTQGTYGAVSAPIGLVRLIAGGAGSIGTCVAPTTTSARIAVNTASGTYVSNAVLSSTVPGTWTTADVIQAQFSYFI